MYQFKNLMLLCFFLILCCREGKAQFGVGQEIGVVAGPLVFFSDFGIRYNFETNTGNTGYGIGIVHYLNFAFRAECDCYAMDSYFNDHFKIRSEIDYSRSELDHFGEIANGNNVRGEMLRAMDGVSEIFEIGAHLEYFPLSIKDFTAWAYPISPFFSLGANFVSYQPQVISTRGPLKDNLIEEFRRGTGEMGGVSLEGGTTWSVVFGTGARYRLVESGDLVINAQWKYYHTDWLDGLNHDNPQNKSKDFLFWLNIGYIYYLNF